MWRWHLLQRIREIKNYTIILVGFSDASCILSMFQLSSKASATNPFWHKIDLLDPHLRAMVLLGYNSSDFSPVLSGDSYVE